MKKLLFVIPEYSHGGTNKSLENLLSLIDKTRYNISVYCLYEDGGEYYKKVFAPYILKKSRLYYWMHDNVVTRKMTGLYNKLTKNYSFEWLYRREVRFLQIKYAFEVVTAYQEGAATKFVSYFNDNVKKIAWIHCDYGAWTNEKRRKTDEVTYSKINHIVCVSETAKKSFTGLFPEWRDNTCVINNLINEKEINLKGEEKILFTGKKQYNRDVFKIVSVGRLTRIKQFEKIPEIVYNIRQQTKIPFTWFVIGSGDCKELINEEIEKYNLQDIVVLLGAKDNPYPYIKQSSLLVCTSVSESYPTVINEAKLLHIPVCSSFFPSVNEVVDDSTGWIANIKDMPQLLARIINNENGEYDRKKASVMRFEYSNQAILQKIDELFEN